MTETTNPYLTPGVGIGMTDKRKRELAIGNVVEVYLDAEPPYDGFAKAVIRWSDTRNCVVFDFFEGVEWTDTEEDYMEYDSSNVLYLAPTMEVYKMDDVSFFLQLDEQQRWAVLTYLRKNNQNNQFQSLLWAEEEKGWKKAENAMFLQDIQNIESLTKVINWIPMNEAEFLFRYLEHHESEFPMSDFVKTYINANRNQEHLASNHVQTLIQEVLSCLEQKQKNEASQN